MGQSNLKQICEQPSMFVKIIVLGRPMMELWGSPGVLHHELLHHEAKVAQPLQHHHLIRRHARPSHPAYQALQTDSIIAKAVSA